MNLHTKKRFFRRVFFALLLAGAITLVAVSVVKKINEDATAISQTGQWVKIIYSPDDKIHYGETPDMEGWDSQGNPNRGTTHHFWTQPNPESSSTRYLSYCANPSLKPLDGTYMVKRLSDSAEKYQLMKMAIFAGTRGGVNPPASVQSVATSLYNKIFANSGAATYFSQAGLADNEDTRYAYIHALLGVLYTDGADVAGLKGHRQLIDNMIAVLRAEKNNNTDAYAIAQSYSIYRVNREEPHPQGYPDGYDASNYDPDEFQDIVWIESSEFGGINVEKRDANFGTTPQGNGNFTNIPFQVRAVGRIYRPDTGTFYNDNDLVASGSTDAQGKVSFSNLPLGTYKVIENGGNAFYDATVPQNATIYYEGHTASLIFYDTIKKGTINVQKIDAETGSCTRLGSASLAGATFSITNKSDHSIYYNGNSIPFNGVVASGTIPAGQCVVSFTNLPYGTYLVTETAVGTGYNQSTVTRTVTIPQNNNATVSVSVPNQVKRGDVTFRKIDTNNGNSPMANVAFKIKSNTTGEEHIVVTNSNGVVNTANSFNPHNYRTNGYDNLSFTAVVGEQKHYVYAGYGTWFGGTTPNNSLGALPYDTYTITEMACFGNKFCYENSTSSKTFRIDSDQTVNLGNWTNDCVVLNITTTATDQADGDKFVLEGASIVVADKINYTLKPGLEYEIRGTLMDKNANVARATSNIRFTPSTENGTTTMLFTVDTRGLKGHDLVAYQEVYYDGEMVVDHKNINDDGQTVSVVSLSTSASDKADSDKFIPVDATSVIRDEVTYCLRAGMSFRIEGTLMDRQTGQPVMNNGNPVTSSKTFTPGTACGVTTMEFSVNTAGLAGHDLVVYEKVYYGSSNLVVSHENINDEAQTVTVVSVATVATDKEDGNKFVIEGTDTVVSDKVNYCLKKGQSFAVTASLIDRTNGRIVVDGNGPVMKTVTVDVDSSNNCGTVTIDLNVDSTGLAGHDLVVYEEVYQSNSPVIAHTVLTDEDQTVTIVSLSTFAEEPSDGDKLIVDGPNAEIKDTLTYCLRANKTFRIEGILMDRQTGEPVMNNGSTITNTKTITPSTACGTTTMNFSFDATGLGGHDIIVYQKIYFGTDDLVIAEEEINSEEQSVTIVKVNTTATDSADGDRYVLPSANTVVKDTVHYCLKPGMTFYTIGRVMDGETGRILVDANGYRVERSKFIEPDEENCGDIELEFTIDTTEMAGRDMVIYEDIYLDEFGDVSLLKHRDIADEEQTLTVVSLSTTASDNADGDKMVVADENSQIKDEVSYCLKAGREFTLIGTLMDKETGELITGIDGEPVTASKTFTPDENCGTTSLIFDVDTSALGGHDVVVFEKAYDDRGDLAVEHSDINDEGQTVTIIDVKTTATDKADDDKYIFAEENVTVVDQVAYCLLPNLTFELEGTLMDKQTGMPVLDAEGNPLVLTKEITPEEKCGNATMEFEVDASLLVGHDLVVFENVYLEGRLILEHADFEDEGQTVTVVSLSTYASDDADGDKLVAAGTSSIINDEVTYCLKAGRTFTLEGTLMDKTTGEPVKDANGEPVRVTREVTPNENCGTTVISFIVDTTGLGGHDLVVFEKAIIDDGTVIEHAGLDDEAQTVKIIEIKTTASDLNGNKYVLLDAETVIVDKVDYCLVKETTYRLVGVLMDKLTGEPVLDENGEPMIQTTTFGSNTDCGSVSLEFTLDTTELLGREFVVFETVYRDDEELISHADIDDWGQTVVIAGYKTYASFKGTNKKELELEKGEVVIEDKVEYCLKADRKFTFVGRLMNKNTGEPILIDGKPVEHKTTFTPTEDCGSFVANYIFDVNKIAAGDFIIVIVDDVYDENGELVLGYHDLNNEDETVVLSVPDTGAHTFDAGGSKDDRIIIVLLGAMFAAVVIVARSCGKAIIGVKK